MLFRGSLLCFFLTSRPTTSTSTLLLGWKITFKPGPARCLLYHTIVLSCKHSYFPQSEYMLKVKFRDAVATDIVHQHSGRLDYYKGNFSQFYATKSERDRNLRREYETQMDYRKHLQAFIDRWRYNANRGA
jgi:hypothetical protein